MKTKLLLLLTLFLCLSGRASAQAFCYTPQFNFYVSRTISATTGTGVPTATTPINLTQTVTLSGHTVIGSQCSMPYPTVQHWATTSNVLKIGTNTYTAPGGTSQRVCASCQINLTTVVSAISNFDWENNTPGPSYNVDCSIGGQFDGGGVASPELSFAYVRVLGLGPSTYKACTWNFAVTQETCDVATKNWCTPATTPADMTVNTVRDQVYPTSYDYWEIIGLCVRSGPGTPWVCPNVALGTIGTAYGLGFHGTPGLASCTARNKAGFP